MAVNWWVPSGGKVTALRSSEIPGVKLSCAVAVLPSESVTVTVPLVVPSNGAVKRPVRVTPPALAVQTRPVPLPPLELNCSVPRGGSVKAVGEIARLAG